MSDLMSPHQQYQSVRVETANPQSLVLMAYDRIIRCLQETQESLQKHPREVETATEQLNKAQQILEVLFDGLDFDAGEVAQLLGSFYEFLRKYIVQANLTKDSDQIEKALDLTQQVKGFWLQSQSMQQKRPSEGSNSQSPKPPSFDSRR
jgi:flagellar protein FliS